MKKRYFVFLLAVVMLALCLLSGCTNNYPGPAPNSSATVYKYNSNNMFGLERIAVDGNTIYVYFEKSRIDENVYLLSALSKINKYTKEEWDAYDLYSKPWSVLCSDANGKAMQQTESTFYENDEYALLVSKFENEISDGYWHLFSTDPYEIDGFSQPVLFYTLFGGECTIDYIQSYDRAAKKWSAVSDELTVCPMFDENGNPL